MRVEDDHYNTEEQPAIKGCIIHNKSIQHTYTVEPPNNGQVGDGHFVHYSEVVPSSEVPPPSGLKLLSHFINDIAYTLDVNSMRWSIELVECGLLLYLPSR